MSSQNSFFLTLHLVLPLLNQLPHLPTYAPHFAMPKTYISSQLYLQLLGKPISLLE
jgi:hypothetical protein